MIDNAKVDPSSPIVVTLILEAIRPSEKSVLTIAIRPNIHEDGVLHSHCHENLKSYNIGYSCVTKYQAELSVYRAYSVHTEIILMRNSSKLDKGDRFTNDNI
jgi:hypothetical protein